LDLPAQHRQLVPEHDDFFELRGSAALVNGTHILVPI
jgi:hypothetical protein